MSSTILYKYGRSRPHSPISTPISVENARSALYTRLKDLKIESFKMGKKAYVNAEQLQRLDDLHSHLQKGGTTGEFLKQRQKKGTVQFQTDNRTDDKAQC